MKNMEPKALVKQPEDVTENPYRKPMKEGKKEKPIPFAAAEEVRVSNRRQNFPDKTWFFLPPQCMSVC